EGPLEGEGPFFLRRPSPAHERNLRTLVGNWHVNTVEEAGQASTENLFEKKRKRKVTTFLESIRKTGNGSSN
ncbi:MAG TPA: hypothetical protein DD706_13345, partial [Nitrospiraceae bacterium]|nr:hypothetical protein [Nitrospiraceae bacterium]